MRSTLKRVWWQLRFTVTSADRFGNPGGNAQDQVAVRVFAPALPAAGVAAAVHNHLNGSFSVDFSAAVASYSTDAVALSGVEALTLEVTVNAQLAGGQPAQNTPLRWCAQGSFGSTSSGECTLCPTGHFSELLLVGKGTCLACDAETTTSAAGARALSECVCLVGFYRVREDAAACTACPATATCLGGTQLPSARPGFYPTSEPSIFVACPRAASCLGGVVFFASSSSFASLLPPLVSLSYGSSVTRQARPSAAPMATRDVCVRNAGPATTRSMARVDDAREASVPLPLWRW